MLQFLYYNSHIKGTAQKQTIMLARDVLCKIKPSIRNVLSVHRICNEREVFLSTKSLKHIYDRHIFDKQSPADFLTIMSSLTKIIRFPDEVRKDMESKRGDFLFVKTINGQPYFISLEVEQDGTINVVSSSATGEKYLKNFTVLWSWGTANPPS